MKLLAFDTSTESLSIALQAGEGAPVRTHEGAGGAQASATLLPAIQQLLREAGVRLAELDAIAFGRGPGSFTGLRTAAAVAQGLGLGSGRPVLPLDTLLAVAEDAHARHGATRVVAVLDARMDEVYWAAYERVAAGWRTVQAPLLAAPETVRLPAGWTLAGPGLSVFGERLPAGGPRAEAAPVAPAFLRLAREFLAAAPAPGPAQALPLYVRDKVAQTTEERAAERARKEQDRGAAAGQP